MLTINILQTIIKIEKNRLKYVKNSTRIPLRLKSLTETRI